MTCPYTAWYWALWSQWSSCPCSNCRNLADWAELVGLTWLTNHGRVEILVDSKLVLFMEVLEDESLEPIGFRRLNLHEVLDIRWGDPDTVAFILSVAYQHFLANAPAMRTEQPFFSVRFWIEHTFDHIYDPNWGPIIDGGWFQARPVVDSNRQPSVSFDVQILEDE